MKLKVGCLVTAAVVLTAGCATTRYEEYGPPAEIGEGPAFDSAGPPVTVTDSSAVARIADLEARLGEIESGSNQLASRVAALTEQVDQLRRRVAAVNAPGALPGPAVEARPVKPAPRETRTAVQKPDDATLGALYALALNDYNAGRFPQALKRLRELQAMDPDGDLADNAQYWIGECQYATRDFKAALETFRGVFRFTETEKDDDAQLKLGLCHLQLGEDEAALIELKRLVVDYPESEYLGRAEELIRQIRRRSESAE